jgi:hypothetical protein
MLTRVAIVCFGAEDERHAQAHLAILTALAHLPAPVEVVVTTDRPQWYRWLGDRIRVVQLTEHLRIAWSGPQRFVWRVVLNAIAETALRGPPANLLYLDTDTLVRRPLGPLLAALESGEVFLHKLESPLCQRRAGSHRGLWKQTRGRSFAGFAIDGRTELWNSGVIGVSAQNVALLSQALEVCDAMTSAGVESWLVEQLADSVVFQSTGRLREALPWIAHYWGNKPGFNQGVREQLVAILLRGMSVKEAIAYVRENSIERPLRIKPRWWHPYFRRLAGAPG